MPLKEKTIVDMREEIARLLLKGYSVTEVGEVFGVSRPTVRLWRDRFAAEGKGGLEDRSHAPRTCPHRTSEEIESLIVAEQRKWGWGSKKIRQRLIDNNPELELPARATFDAIFARHGLTVRRRRLRAAGQTPFARRYEAREPGELTTIDHKGQFRMGNGQYCYPLTMVDHVSRYLLACQGLRSTSLELAWPVIERVFLEHGSPRAMQSDNGPPFGAPGRGRLSTLSVRLMKHGIQPIFIHPGQPQENGAHERMHRTLKAATTRPPGHDMSSQQKKFDQFRHDFNVERPHEGIQMQRPAVVYKPIRRAYSRRTKRYEYDTGFEQRVVSKTGTISWQKRHLFVGEALRGERIALEPTEDRTQTLHFYGFILGKLDEETGTID
jgi:transposase InsO family protein